MKYSYLHIQKHCILLLFYIFLAVSGVSAEKKIPSVTQTAEGTFSGDFVVYRDYSWKEPTWIGFLYYDDETYGALLYTPDTNSRVSILFSCKPENGILTLIGQNIISSITKDDTFAVNYLMTVLPKLYEKKMLPAVPNQLISRKIEKSDIYEFGGSVTMQFENSIPLFHLRSLKNNEKGLVLELAEQGSIKGSGEHTFYEYTPPKAKQMKNYFKKDKKAKQETVTVNNLRFPLDSQWKKIADNSFLCGSIAFLTVNTLQLPDLGDTNIPETARLIRLFATSSIYAKVLVPYTVTEGTNNDFTVTQSVYDVQLQKINKDIKRCIKNKDGSYTIISLTIDNQAYTAEKEYFTGIFRLL